MMMTWEWLAGLIAAGASVWGVWTYNRFIALRNQVREAWSGIDVQLRRRYELVPRLVESVKAYGRHEREVLTQVAVLRGEAERDSVAERGARESALSGEIRRLVAVAEAYPDLKASEVYLDLQRGLAEVEDHLQYARRYYNGSVRDWNVYRQSFPSLLIARLAGFRDAEFFQLELASERDAPEVRL